MYIMTISTVVVARALMLGWKSGIMREVAASVVSWVERETRSLSLRSSITRLSAEILSKGKYSAL